MKKIILLTDIAINRKVSNFDTKIIKTLEISNQKLKKEVRLPLLANQYVSLIIRIA